MWFFFPQWIILGLCLLSSNYLLRLLHVARPGMEDHQAHEKERRLDFHLCPALFLTSFWQIWGMENSLVSLHSTLYLNTWFKNISSVLKKKKSPLKEREKKLSIHWLIPQMAARACLKPWARSQDFLLGPPHGYRGQSFWAMFCCSPRHVIMELDQKWSHWNSNWCPYGMLAL